MRRPRGLVLLLFVLLLSQPVRTARSILEEEGDTNEFQAAERFSDSYARTVCAGPKGEGLSERHEVLRALCAEMGGIGQWFQGQQDKLQREIASLGGAEAEERRIAGQTRIFEQANLRAQEVQTLMASAQCFGHEEISEEARRKATRETTKAGKRACSKALKMQETLRAMHAESLRLSSPRAVKLPLLNAPELLLEVLSTSGDPAVNPNALRISLSEVIEGRRKKYSTRSMINDADLREYEKYKEKLLEL